MEVEIRPATLDDLDPINEIYNFYVRESTCTYQTEPEPLQSRIEWFQNREPKHPVVVADDNSQVVGWGAISPFKTRSAYQNTGEVSFYVDHSFLHRGIGTAILEALLAHAKKASLHTLIACISAEQEPSIRLCEKLGFKISGRFAEVGCKFDTWLDAVYLQYMVEDI